MAAAGFDVYFADRRGSGLNGRQRGHADHGQRLLNDARQLLKLARNEHPGIPCTLMGLSWGGKLAVAAASQFPDLVDSLALLYPGTDPRIQANWWQRRQLAFARRHDVRFKSVELPLEDPALFTAQPLHQDFIQDDPLALHRVTSGFLNAGRDIDCLVEKAGPRIAQPTLLMLADADEVINNDKCVDRITSFASRSITIRRYEAARHTLEFEPDRDRIFGDLVTWLNDVSAGSDVADAENTQSTANQTRYRRA